MSEIPYSIVYLPGVVDHISRDPRFAANTVQHIWTVLHGPGRPTSICRSDTRSLWFLWTATDNYANHNMTKWKCWTTTTKSGRNMVTRPYGTCSDAAWPPYKFHGRRTKCAHCCRLDILFCNDRTNFANARGGGITSSMWCDRDSSSHGIGRTFPAVITCLRIYARSLRRSIPDVN